MSIPRDPHQATHNWKLIYHYVKCPKCEYIIESRQDYEYRLDKYQKDLKCSRCQHQFTVTKNEEPSLGPLLGG